MKDGSPLSNSLKSCDLSIQNLLHAVWMEGKSGLTCVAPGVEAMIYPSSEAHSNNGSA